MVTLTRLPPKLKKKQRVVEVQNIYRFHWSVILGLFLVIDLELLFVSISTEKKISYML